MTNDQFRVLEEISGNRRPSLPDDSGGKADELLVAAIAAFAAITRPGRQDVQQFEDLALPLLQNASARGKRRAANALAPLDHAPRSLVLALANEPVEISAPLLLRSPLLRPADLIDMISRNGLDHARAIARRQSADPLLKDVLRSFSDAAINRLLKLQENLETEQFEPPATAHPAPSDETGSGQMALSLRQPFLSSGAITGASHLINTALLIDDQIFRTALADALDLSFERADAIIGQWPDSYLPIALRALGLSASECYLIMTSVLGPIDADRDNLREFVHIYRSIDHDKAAALVRRWRADDMSKLLRSKLREMVQAQDGAKVEKAAN
ncbi:DUF2336 domain-containing protein [Falsochrobactrum shanghaiense]|uniref:DUF2336 domain-containing protein n=1 Tax=Falsochrobactrum shanghaiense TaxID=2201899 RepID=A0A316JAY8_9HYPH|nr:DUF2336 domain-containing protein [Falsochrobactrum shanghaiense]PWL19042.1 DUF2336 domain-containing protein [Falsochrobactrum shanghaiense]